MGREQVLRSSQEVISVAPVSNNTRRQPVAFIAIAVALLVFLAFVSIFVGSRSVSFSDVISILTLGPSVDRAALPAGLNSDEYGIVWDLRMPRTLLAIVVGAALALAGAIAQVWTRNPLADPGLIGVNAGAGFAVAAALTLGWATTIAQRTIFGLVGAACAVLIVLVVSRVSREPLTLVLVGVGVTFGLQAATSLMGLSSSDSLDGIRRWSVGSTAGRGMDDVGFAAIGLVIGIIVAFAVAKSLDMLAMGEEAAAALGVSPRNVRWAAGLAIVVLAGSATATVGLVTFLGFAVPHIIRKFTGPALTRLLFPAALMGAGALLAADIAGRFLIQPNEVEMSILVAIVGAPIMIATVRERNASTTGRRKKKKNTAVPA